MNNQIKIFFVVLILTATGCKKYLDKSPLDSINTANFFQTADDAIAAINGAYQPLQWPKLHNLRLWTTDIWAANSIVGAGGGTDGIETQDIANFVTATDNAAALDIWRGPAPGILRCNLVLKHVPSIDMDESLRNRVVGEAHFLRAYYYFILVRLFGDVPLITEPVMAEDNLRPARTSSEQVYNLITDDLTQAAQLLPVSYTGADLGRVTKGAALGMLAKVHLTLGNWEQALNNCQQVTALGYELNIRYGDNFSTAHENSKESLFEIQYAGKTAFSFWSNENQASWASTFMGPRNADFVGGGYGWNQPTSEFMNLYEENDSRKNFTVLYDGGPSFDGKTYQPTYSVTGFNVRKWLVPKSVSPDYDTNPLNWPVLRYADVLLMAAEALCELNRIPEAVVPLNEVRERAGLIGIEPASQAAVREHIRKERRVELAFEGSHWFDIIRYDNGQYAQQYFQQLGKSNFQQRHLLLPIPQREIDANPNLTQNPGY